jgi:inosine-uridine nucleoside N-ribohydrolase
MPQKIIIDTDPGVDDSLAIFTALRSPELEVVGLTTIFGNSLVENTTLNALRLVELEGNQHVPVACGSALPLVVGLELIAAPVHGEDGMGNTFLPLPRGKALDIPAAQFIVEMVLANPGEITLVPVGPLTNIALALRLEPRIAGLVKQVVIMGGATIVPGNISPVAEANIFHDPHAAEIVFSADWPMTMVGLDVTTQVNMSPQYLEKLGQGGNLATDLMRRMLPCYVAFHDQFYGMGGAIHTHDPSAITCVLHPEWFRCEAWPVHVQTDGRCKGQTIADRHRQWPTRRPVNVCVEVDAEKELALIMERMTK